MIYIKSFKNYAEFKQMFPIIEHENGAKSRKNKILLGCLKNRKFIHWWRKYSKNRNLKEDILNCKDMTDLSQFLLKLIRFHAYNDEMLSGGHSADYSHERGKWWLESRVYDVDNGGICEDGDTKCVRYYNAEKDRVFKMKAGKFFCHCMETYRGLRLMPEQAKRWLSEEFAADWEAYAEHERNVTRYTLYVGNDLQDFSDIYDENMCEGDFGSCMAGEDQYAFYKNAVKSSAACLKNEFGKIVARCVIFDDVMDSENNRYRLAERQYSTDGKESLKRLLVNKLIEEGRIDGYKKVGVDCHDNRNFIAVNGDSLRDKKFCIECNLEDGDTLSYQDSFVYFDYKRNEAYNYPAMGYTDELNTTNSSFERSHYNEEWSDAYNEYIDADDAVWDEYNQVYIREEDAVSASYRGDHIQLYQYYTDNFYWSNTEDEYIHEDECVYIDSIDDYVYNDDAVEDINGDYQLADDCVWSHYEQKYILKEDSVHSDYEDDDLFKDTSAYSELLKDWFGDEDDRIEAEKEHRKNHALMCIA